MSIFEDHFYLAALCATVPGLGRENIVRLRLRFSSCEELFKATERELMQADCGELACKKFIAHRNLHLPGQIKRFCLHNDVTLVTIADENYPESLKNINDPPLVLYVKGQLPDLNSAIAVVGSRKCSEYGAAAATYFADGLARLGIPIISGGAYGIDTAAHMAALAAGGTTVAVLGSGLDVPYPQRNLPMFRNIAKQGCLISEFPPGTMALPANFPMRNRIIVGLASGVLVVEAARKSGAIITANIAIDENRDVYCVPGSIFQETSIGCHDLIRAGAKLVDRIEDILGEQDPYKPRRAIEQSLFAEPIRKTARVKKAVQEVYTKVPKPKILEPQLTPRQLLILKVLGRQHLYLDDIMEGAQLDLSALSIELLELQVKCLVSQDEAQRYYRT